jgi:hypothetical protein
MQASVPATVSLPVSASTSRRRTRSRSYGGRSRSYSRGRSYGGRRRSSRLSRYQARAIARRAYVRAKWPSSQYAHVRIPRGSAAARALGLTSGAKFSEVTPEEQALRRGMQWYGQGGYVGRTLGAALGGALGTMAGTGLATATKGSAAPLVPLLGAVGGKLGGDFGDKAGDWLWDRSE